MRIPTLPLILLLFTVSTALSQRPWISGAWPEVGPNPKFAFVTGTLIAYDTAVASSFNHAETWQTEFEITGIVRGTTNFPSVSASLVFTQSEAGAPVFGYFSQDGTNWSIFDTIDVGDRLIVGAGASGNDYILATNSNKVISVGTGGKIEIAVSSDPTVVISEFVSSQSELAVTTNTGVRMSTDRGQTWRDVTSDDGIPPSVTVSDLIVVESAVYAAGDFGMMRLDPTSASWKQMGRWPDSLGGVPVIAAAAGDISNLVALVKINNHHQMYRLPLSDTMWIESAFPLPGTNPASGRNSLIIDVGWAVTNHQPEQPDSAGIYRFDINDLTSVEQDDEVAQVRIVPTASGLQIVGAPSQPVHITISDLLAAILFDADILQGAGNIALTQNATGVMGVTLTLADRRVIRRMVIR